MQFLSPCFDLSPHGSIKSNGLGLAEDGLEGIDTQARETEAGLPVHDVIARSGLSDEAVHEQVKLLIDGLAYGLNGSRTQTLVAKEPRELRPGFGVAGHSDRV